MANLDEIMGIGSGDRKTEGRFKVQMVHYAKLLPSKQNQYSMSNIIELANMILLSGELKQNILAKKTAPDVYEIISGHRRQAAIRYLVEVKGLTEFQMVPVHLEESGDAIAKLNLYLTNAGQRDKTDYDYMIEVEGITEALEALQYGDERDRKVFYDFCELDPGYQVGGRTLRGIIAKKLGLSETKVANLKHINSKLSPELKEKFREGEIGISAANTAAGLSAEGQKKLAEIPSVSIADAEKQKEQEEQGREERKQEEEQLPGQISMYESGENLPGTVAIEGQAIQPSEEPEKRIFEAGQPRGSENHRIRISWQEYDAIVREKKMYKLIRNDQDFREGDEIEMMRFKNGRNTGHMIEAIISYLDEDIEGLKDGYCVFGFRIASYDVGEEERD